MVSLFTGKEHNLNFFLALGDHFAMSGPPIESLFDDSSIPWLHRELNRHNTPAYELGMWMKAVAKGNADALRKYSHVAVEKLPDQIAAGAYRSGFTNEGFHEMPISGLLAVQGAEPGAFSSIISYLDLDRAAMQAAISMLGGWKLKFWGVRCKGPAAESIKPLLDTGVDETQLNSMIDDVFNINSATLPSLQQNGRLRPAVEASFASLIHYYDLRIEKREMLTVANKLRAAYRRCFPGSSSALDSAGVLSSWSSIVHVEWAAVNAEVGNSTGGSDGAVATPTADSTSGQALEQLVKIATGMSSSLESVVPVMNDLQHKVEHLAESVKTIERVVRMMSTPEHAVENSVVWSADGESSKNSMVSSPAGRLSQSSSLKSPAQGSSSSALSPMEIMAGPPIVQNAFSIMMGEEKTDENQAQSLMKLKIQDMFFKKYESLASSQPLVGAPTTRQDKRRFALVMSWMDAMLKAEELAVMRSKLSSDKGRKQQMADLSAKLLAAFLRDQLPEKAQVPRSLQAPKKKCAQPKELTANSIENILGKLKEAVTEENMVSHENSIVIAAWREKYDAKQAAMQRKDGKRKRT